MKPILFMILSLFLTAGPLSAADGVRVTINGHELEGTVISSPDVIDVKMKVGLIIKVNLDANPT
ncbi:MAG: hypothetical protein PHN75_18980, partial [Syntrophales bacterium]|nr:hypothetical protein [Syntrophales bacterium]